MMFSIGFAYCWFCQLPETRNNIYAIKHQFRHIFGKVHLQVKLETEYSKEICITNLWSCDFRKEVYKGMRCLYKKNNFIVPLYGQGSTATATTRRQFTFYHKSPEIYSTQLINL